MKLGPIAIGAGAGVLLLLASLPLVGGAIGGLAEARAERARLEAALAAPVERSPLVAPGLAIDGGQADAARTLATRVRALAGSGGVLVEDARPLASAGGLAVLGIRLSGPEKAVLALVDSLEREAPLVRLRRWRIAALAEGGVRLDGEAVAAWR